MHTALVNRTGRLLAGFAVVIALKAAPIDACTLLSPEVIQRTTGEQVTNTKATSASAGKVRQSQCFYTLPTFINSISLTLTGPSGLLRDAAREMWQRWFHRGEVGDDKDRGKDREWDKDRGKPESEEEEAAASAVPISGVGDEAFWVHSFVGNLYVRKGNQFIRISLGGKLNDDERQIKAKALAADALRRLR